MDDAVSSDDGNTTNQIDETQPPDRLLDGSMQDINTLPAQADDTTLEATTTLVEVDQSDNGVAPEQDDNAMFFAGGVLLGLLLLAIIAYFITKRRKSTNRGTNQGEDPKQ